MELLIHTPEEMRRLARMLAVLLDQGDIVTLEGELGVGKTTFAQGFAAGLGVRQVVNSPTYTLLKEYDGHLPFYHMDLYRLDGEEDVGLDEVLGGAGVSLVEWPERLGSLMPQQRLQVRIQRLSGGARQLQVTPLGERYETICRQWLENWRQGAAGEGGQG